MIKQACDKIVGIMAEHTMSTARANGNLPVVSSHCTKGTADTRDGKGGFMSLKQFEEFYWPALRELMGILIDDGFVPDLLCEGDFTSRLEIIKDVPPGTYIYHFEQVNR